MKMAIKKYIGRKIAIMVFRPWENRYYSHDHYTEISSHSFKHGCRLFEICQIDLRSLTLATRHFEENESLNGGTIVPPAYGPFGHS